MHIKILTSMLFLNSVFQLAAMDDNPFKTSDSASRDEIRVARDGRAEGGRFNLTGLEDRLSGVEKSIKGLEQKIYAENRKNMLRAFVVGTVVGVVAAKFGPGLLKQAKDTLKQRL